MRFLAQEQRVVLTFHLDFGDIAVNPRLFRVISDCESGLASGAIIVVEDQGYRVRRLPIRR